MQDIVKFVISMVIAVTFATIFVFTIPYWPVAKQLGLETPNSSLVRLHPTLPDSPVVTLELDLAIPNFDIKGLRELSSLVVLGKVVKQTQGPALDLGRDNKMPQVSNTIQIERVLKGNYKDDTLNILTPGSMSNKVIVEDAYKLKGGERAIFMVHPIKGGYVVVGYDQGKYQIQGDSVRGKFVKGMNLDNFRVSMLGIDPDVIRQEHQLEKPQLQQEQSQIQSHDPESNKQQQIPKDQTIPGDKPNMKQRQDDRHEQLREQRIENRTS